MGSAWPANVIMFSMLPVRYHASFMAVSSFLYQNVLSLLSNKERTLIRSSTRQKSP